MNVLVYKPKNGLYTFPKHLKPSVLLKKHSKAQKHIQFTWISDREKQQIFAAEKLELDLHSNMEKFLELLMQRKDNCLIH